MRINFIMIVMIVIVIFIIAMIVSPTQVFVTRRGGERVNTDEQRNLEGAITSRQCKIYTLSIMFKRNRQGSSLVVLSKQARFLFFLSLEKEIHITETYPITILILFLPLPFGASRVLLV